MTINAMHVIKHGPRSCDGYCRVVMSVMLMWALTWLALPAIAQETAPTPDAAPTTEAAATNLLDTERWVDRKYGISALPPLGAKLLQQTGDDHLLRILDGEARYQITIDVKRSRSNLSLAQVGEWARHQISERHDASRVVERRETTINGRPAEVQFFAIPEGPGAEVMKGQALIFINTQTFAVVEIDCSAEHSEEAYKVYEQLIKTVQIADQDALAQQRRAAIERTEAWRRQVTPEKLKAALGDQQFYRIVENDRDIGWIRVTQATGEFNAMDGVQVVVEMHLETNDLKIDSKAEYFRPLESAVGEVWTVHTGIRRPNTREQPQAILETGTGLMGSLDIRVEGTAGVKARDQTYPRPPHGYLTQAEGWLLPQLLPRDMPGEYGFYWYNSTKGDVSFRMDRLTPTPAGFTIATRLDPNAPELRSTYDREGRLISRDLGAERKMLRTDAGRLRALWQLR